MINTGGNKVSDPCGSFCVNKASVRDHGIPVWSGIGMGPLSHVSQEESHMILGFKYGFLGQTSSFSDLFSKLNQAHSDA